MVRSVTKCEQIKVLAKVKYSELVHLSML